MKLPIEKNYIKNYLVFRFINTETMGSIYFKSILMVFLTFRRGPESAADRGSGRARLFAQIFSFEKCT